MTTARLVLLLATFAAQVFGAGILPTDFSNPVITTFDGLNIGDNPGGASSSVKLNYVLNDNTYSSSVQSTLLYGDLGGTGDCFANECIGSSSARGTLTITFGAATSMAGFYLGVSSAQVTFFSPIGTQLDSEAVTPPSLDASNTWIGWGDTATIGSITVTGLDSTHIFSIDNLTTQATVDGSNAAPEPNAVILMCIGGVALLGRSLLRRR